MATGGAGARCHPIEMNKREEANALFTEVMARFVGRTHAIRSLRRVVSTNLPTAVRTMAEENARSVKEITPGLMTGDFLKFVERGGLPEFGRIMAHQAALDAIDVLDAAAFVFAHAVLDDAALTCCRITMLLAPDEWGAQLDT